jgi:RNA polymerase sigma-70 factor (ECF subfamily)
VVYCIIPRELAPELHDTLRRFYRNDPSIEVIVERRRRERRSGRDKRRPEAPVDGIREERRRIRGRGGRRVGERRAAQKRARRGRLPPEAEPHAGRLAFVRRVAPSSQEEEDLDTGWLVTRIQAGERGVFDEVYMRYFDRVYGYLRACLADPHDAEDATQQLFLNVLEALPAYELRGPPFRTWMFRIARNIAIDQLQRRGATELCPPDELDRRREAPDRPSAAAFKELSDSEILHLVEQLPEVQRRVIVMRYVLDLDVAEIADVLERSPEAVRQLQHRALRTLERRAAALARKRRRE